MKILNHIFPSEILIVLGFIYTVLILCSFSFFILSKKSKSEGLSELILRTKSWWFIVFGISILVLSPQIIATIMLGYISFVSLREMFSIGRLRSADRIGLFIAYLAVPIQYTIAYFGNYESFVSFIPIIMFILIPTVLVLKGNTELIGRSMSIIPTTLILTVYFLSHLAFLFNIKFEGFENNGGSLILFLLLITGFNDVFQFTWGKLLGKHKILPKVSPNKTWEGFLGGVLTTGVLSYFLSFLTPLNAKSCLVIGIVIGITGFIGDVIISAVKRDLNIKDTSNVIPGHGGIMDRLDSIVLTAPIFYYLLIILK